jgi:phytoene dehydrogenase-like protein
LKGAVRVALEVSPKKAFATAVDWPGWSRSGKTPELALEALAAYADRYGPVAAKAGERLPIDANADPPTAFEVLEEVAGDGGTAFGVPSRATEADRRRTTPADAKRLRGLVAAAWFAFDRVAAASPPELRKGPRGGGRDRDKMIEHVLGADAAYAREMGLRIPEPARGDRAALDAIRVAMLGVLGTPSDGSPIAGRKWTLRYAAHRIAWHALDHAWEMEDRSEPA